jgi:hypothetical protein
VKPYALFSVSLVAGALLAGCQPRVVAIEVMPPRTSTTCSAPNLKSSAAGRGLLDLDASRILHGSYESDLRITSRGELRIDGIALTFTLPEDASDASTEEAVRVSGLYPAGDLYLAGDDEDPTAGMIEDVVLLPRSLAVALRDDASLQADEVVYSTVDVRIEATNGGQSLEAIAASFPIDVCRGCLVAEPSTDECAGGFEDTGACRPGQDVELYQCAAAAPPAGFP